MPVRSGINDFMGRFGLIFGNIFFKLTLLIWAVLDGGKFVIKMIEGKEEKKKSHMISRLLVKKLSPTALLPKKGSSLAAGYDICSD